MADPVQGFGAREQSINDILQAAFQILTYEKVCARCFVLQSW
jgi:hypothetical protein